MSIMLAHDDAEPPGRAVHGRKNCGCDWRTTLCVGNSRREPLSTKSSWQNAFLYRARRSARQFVC
jgi:hypothetical protein